MLGYERAKRVEAWVGWLALGGTALVLLPGWTLGQNPAAPALPAVGPQAVITVQASEPAAAPAAEAAPAAALPRIPVDLPVAAQASPVAVAPALPGTVVYSAVANDGDVREQHLRNIEARIEQLLAELRSLQSVQAATTPAAALPAPTAVPANAAAPSRIDIYSRSAKRFRAATQLATPPNDVLQPYPAATLEATPVQITQPVLQNVPRVTQRLNRYGYVAIVEAQDGVEQTQLVRAKYSLPGAKADALAAFIGQNLTDVETKVAGDTITVTAIPDAQAIVGQFISLMKRAGPPADANAAQAPATVPAAVPPASATEPGSVQ